MNLISFIIWSERLVVNFLKEIILLNYKFKGFHFIDFIFLCWYNLDHIIASFFKCLIIFCKHYLLTLPIMLQVIKHSGQICVVLAVYEIESIQIYSLIIYPTICSNWLLTISSYWLLLLLLLLLLLFDFTYILINILICL